MTEASLSSDSRGNLRQLSESLVCLVLAVLIFRTFQLEGYMISTGSMAPHLLGFHKRVTCPTCRYQFAVGVSQDNGDLQAVNSSEKKQISRVPLDDDPQQRTLYPTSARGSLAVCPNCGRDSLDISGTPRNQGDQLLVHKNAYQFGLPKRWEVIVFRNPQKPLQAYVKRVVGLPGETVQVIDGDVHRFENGSYSICRKNLSSQRAVRIPVYDHDFEPQNDATWKPRWVPESAPREWRPIPHGFAFDGLASRQGESPPPLAWVKYRHWIRSGGSHRTSLQLEGIKNSVPLSSSLLQPLRYNPFTETLSCYGVLPDWERDRLQRVVDDPRFADAVQRLSEQSHIAPIDDRYGYNRTSRSEPSNSVRDLMISLEVTVANGLITRVHRDIPEANAHGEYTGVAKFSAEGANKLQKHYWRARGHYAGKPYREAVVFEKAYLIHLLQDMIECGIDCAHADVHGGYIEVDTLQDHAYACRVWKSSPVSHAV
ncbi:MAG: signal peptidase I [Planctomycetes bacterium]|nr:signal peptidase I [Planctomycetota bacterium]